MLISEEAKKQSRIARSELVDLEPLLKIQLKIRVGEVPKSREAVLLRHSEAARKIAEQREAGEIDLEAHASLTAITREMFAAVMMTENGDRFTVEQVDELIDLLPVGAGGNSFTQRVFEIVGGKTKAAAGPLEG